MQYALWKRSYIDTGIPSPTRPPMVVSRTNVNFVILIVSSAFLVQHALEKSYRGFPPPTCLLIVRLPTLEIEKKQILSDVNSEWAE